MKVMDLLYSGNIYPVEQVVSKNPKYREASRTADNLMSELKEALSEEKSGQLEEICDLLSDAHDIQNKEFFSYGVAFGILLIQETMEVLQTHIKSCK